MSFKTKGGGEFKQGEFFRKQTGTFVYMVTEHAYAARPGKGISFKGTPTAFSTTETYVVCGYGLFARQVEGYNLSGKLPKGPSNPYPAVPAQQPKTKLQDLIEAVDSIPDLLRLAKSCMKVKKLLDADTELV